MAHVGHTATDGFFGNRLARGALGSHEQHGTAIGDNPSDEFAGFLVQGERALQVDDMDAVAFAEDEGRHLRVPEARLVAEMHAGFQHPPHGYVGHESTSVGLVLHVAPASNSGFHPEHPATGSGTCV